MEALAASMKEYLESATFTEAHGKRAFKLGG